MSKGVDAGFVKEFYGKLSDQELIRIVSQDAGGITPEAMQVIKEEIAARNLNPGLTDIVAAQNKAYTIEELDELAIVLEALPCPNCKKTGMPLTAVVLSRTMRFVVVTQHSTRLIEGCGECVKAESNSNLGVSLLLGWWGFPWGIIRTIQSIKKYMDAQSALQQPGVNDYMRSFVLSNIGLLTMYKNDPQRLSTIIYNLYKKQPLTLGV